MYLSERIAFFPHDDAQHLLELLHAQLFSYCPTFLLCIFWGQPRSAFSACIVMHSLGCLSSCSAFRLSANFSAMPFFGVNPGQLFFLMLMLSICWSSFLLNFVFLAQLFCDVPFWSQPRSVFLYMYRPTFVGCWAIHVKKLQKGT